MTFRTIESEGPLRLVVVGAGGMGQAWAHTITAAPDAELVGLVDLSPASTEAAAAALGIPGLELGSDAVDVAERAGAHAIVNATSPEAHHPVTTAALFAGFPVLGEKPVASTVAEGLSLAAAAEHTGELFMVSQSRRYRHALHRAKGRLDTLGAIGIVAVDFFKAPRFGGFREAMASPLLLDMAIHQFDMARFLLDADPVSVFCDEHNPDWSWYKGDAAATAVFAMEGGARFVFNGSWCSPGFETSWNGSWRISAERGTVLWDGEGEPRTDPEPATDITVDDPGHEITGSLREFIAALRHGREPMGRVHANVMSLAMVEAAVQSAAQGQRVAIDDVLTRSYEAALATERVAEVLTTMKSWTSVRDALSQRSHRSE